ncbi:hypothetical protein DSO57_1017958 [Entomophthora muscae]|uniref:Uncharacterized protein n=1 Tax=Entomophthora muscae TaxID=34485 RepID=A0ACC2SH89_9FUNG|nr:hypothetical protein DSO57_1017958 [Entomophthora muscae]
MVLGLHIQEILSLQAAVTNYWDQFAAYQQWISFLFSLVSDNQNNLVTSQSCLVTLIEQIHSSIPYYVGEHLYEFHQSQQPWQTQVDYTLNAYLSNFKQLVKQLNALSAYSFDQLQQVAEHAAQGLHELQEEVAQERASTAAFIAKLQAQVNKFSVPKLDVPPSFLYLMI